MKQLGKLKINEMQNFAPIDEKDQMCLKGGYTVDEIYAALCSAVAEAKQKENTAVADKTAVAKPYVAPVNTNGSPIMPSANTATLQTDPTTTLPYLWDQMNNSDPGNSPVFTPLGEYLFRPK
jgi:hypothetical protein